MVKNKNNIALFFSLISTTVAFMPYYWNSLFGDASPIYIEEGIPVCLWIISVLILNIFRTKKIMYFWWVWLSVPFCFLPLATTLFTFICWKLKGFAP
jgi:hypothetical protein